MRRERMGHTSNWWCPWLTSGTSVRSPTRLVICSVCPSKKLDAVIYYESGMWSSIPVLQAGRNLTFSLKRSISRLRENLPEENRLLLDDDPNKFVAKMGAEAVYDLLKDIDLVRLAAELRHKANIDGSQQRKTEALKRLQVVNSFLASADRNKPEWMVLKAVPVIPPELRPSCRLMADVSLLPT